MNILIIIPSVFSLLFAEPLIPSIGLLLLLYYDNIIITKL